SGRFLVKTDSWKDVDIEVYYQEGHEYNIERIINAVKKSLEYMTANFSPYPHKELRVVEFPRYETFAQSFATLIPFSEGAGFIAKFDGSKVDYVFDITAHEVAHQWWAHQVIGANVQGATLLSEVLSQYSALAILKKEFSRFQFDGNVRFELKRYLRGRAEERHKELPLVSIEDQGYIHYGKGLVVMNALRHYAGEEALNLALKKYVDSVIFQEPPYTTSLEFIEYIREAVPDHLQYIIADMFESITLYENRVLEASCKRLDNGRHVVRVKFEARKLKGDEQGNESPVDIGDYIQFAVFGGNRVLYLETHFITPEVNELEFIVDGVPERAAIDPHYYLVDKNVADNEKPVRFQKPAGTIQ
ncbi:MAG: M1 family metallopeptidase, partial [bacterium]|nr:M1 family metallopeptidase [bacterium]